LSGVNHGKSRSACETEEDVLSGERAMGEEEEEEEREEVCRRLRC
jgi:hypothetical protein